MQILNPTKRYVESPISDINLKFIAYQTKKKDSPQGLADFLSQKKQYEKEKNLSNFWRFYGTINMLSPLTHKNPNMSSKKELFKKTYDANRLEFTNMFYVYLVVLDEIVQINATTSKYKYKILTKFDDCDIYNAAFAQNIYNEQIFNFNFRKYFDNSNNNKYSLYFAKKTETLFIDSILDGNIFETQTQNIIEYQYGNYNFLLGVDGLVKFKFLRYFDLSTDKNTSMFVNNKHYRYENIVFKVLPDMDDTNTQQIFTDFINIYDEQTQIFDADETLKNLC